MFRSSTTDKKGDHISVCVCTYKRAKQLEKLLHELQNQNIISLFTYSIVVVDNDIERSAERVVEIFKKGSSIAIEYYNEPEQNISLARNMAVKKSQGDFVAFIDDDEFPVKDWLIRLYKICISYGVDGVLGPVKPHFEITPPLWIVKGGLLERNSFPTGTNLTNSRDTRTGNVLFKKSIFEKYEGPFNPNLGRVGGEDTDFFSRALASGSCFVWCNEAIVFESVPQDRLTRRYMLRRALLRGAVNARRNPFDIMGTFKSFLAIVIYSLALPFLFIIGQHQFMKYLIKCCDHIGKVLGSINIEPVKERDL